MNQSQFLGILTISTAYDVYLWAILELYSCNNAVFYTSSMLVESPMALCNARLVGNIKAVFVDVGILCISFLPL